ncbi:MAG: hypothetical protein FGM57_02270 [Candidatus Taylorbacteria bacterium]|nr:hypothetical protein [Candidatus Taylorbacteria bacterium]
MEILYKKGHILSLHQFETEHHEGLKIDYKKRLDYLTRCGYKFDSETKTKVLKEIIENEYKLYLEKPHAYRNNAEYVMQYAEEIEFRLKEKIKSIYIGIVVIVAILVLLMWQTSGSGGNPSYLQEVCPGCDQF